VGRLPCTPKILDPNRHFIPTLSYGSFNTFVGHIEGSTGKIDKLNGANAIASYQYLSSDGFLTHSYLRRSTIYVKYIQPIGKMSTLTFLTHGQLDQIRKSGTSHKLRLTALAATSV